VYYVYILASRKHGTLYVGMTSDLIGRVFQHRSKAVPGFTSRHGVSKLVWYESYDDPVNAITREKQLKKWRRDWKINLIEQSNQEWIDLYPSLSVQRCRSPSFRGAAKRRTRKPYSSAEPCGTSRSHRTAGEYGFRAPRCAAPE
jgi:putative endonuclease